MESKVLIDSLLEAMEDSPAPIYARVKNAIVKKISALEWVPNQRLPSEAELVKALGVSRMTINRALRELTNEGLLVRQQGLGTYVAQQKVQSALFEVHNIADEIAQRGNKHHTRVLHLSSGSASTDEAMQLGLRTGSGIYRSLLVHCENDQPVQMEERIVNAGLVPEYLDQDFTQTTPHIYLNKAAPISEGEHLVEAVVPKAKEMELLGLTSMQACLQIKRRTWSAGQLITSVRLLSPGPVLQLFGRFQR